MILVCYGTRPEWIKVKPLIDEMKSRGVKHKVLFTGQHKDLASGQFDYIIRMKDGVNRLDSIVESCMNAECWDGITYTLVQGDTSTAFAMALASFHRQKPVIHLEAGLRTGDKKNPYPEEINRRMISAIADIHLCPTDENASNIFNERTEGKRHVVGNTVLDTIDPNTPDDIMQRKVLVTMHRRENHHNMSEWFEVINKIAGKHPELEFVIPLHPNPNVQMYKYLLRNLNVINPVNREELIELIKESNLVISDSGGIQEECSFLKRRVIVCRKVTERPESVGTTSFLCGEPNQLEDVFEQNIYRIEVNEECPFGDGHSSKRIVDILEKL